tara:strand:- start:1927 stop:2082 length:156 start_codon:yes stop_codon:yes gene_type:complete
MKIYNLLQKNDQPFLIALSISKKWILISDKFILIKALELFKYLKKESKTHE